MRSCQLRLAWHRPPHLATLWTNRRSLEIVMTQERTTINEVPAGRTAAKATELAKRFEAAFTPGTAERDGFYRSRKVG
jgi:hypothetical protein